jgi:hypothetical protein
MSEEKKILQNQTADDWTEVMASKAGRRRVFSLLRDSGVLQHMHTTDPATALAFHAVRSLGFMIFTQVCDAAPENVLTMMRESMFSSLDI